MLQTENTFSILLKIIDEFDVQMSSVLHLQVWGPNGYHLPINVTHDTHKKVSHKVPLTFRKHWKDVGAETLTSNKRRKKHSRCLERTVYNLLKVFVINMSTNPGTGMPCFRGYQLFDCLFHVKNLGTSVYINVFANWPTTSCRLQRLKNSVRVFLELLKLVVVQSVL